VEKPEIFDRVSVGKTGLVPVPDRRYSTWKTDAGLAATVLPSHVRLIGLVVTWKQVSWIDAGPIVARMAQMLFR
jgi:hypothetical protein